VSEGGRKDAEEMIERFALFVSVAMFPTICFAQIFGPSTYDDCVLKGIKDAKTDGAVIALMDACANRFPKNKGGAIVGECNLTWNGEKFLRGAPQDSSKFVAVRFPRTADLVYMPVQMDKKLMRQIIEQRITEIRKVCPGVTLD